MTRRLPLLLWVLALSAAGLRIWDAFTHAIPLTQPWQQATGHLLDYRDIIVGPGRFLLSGGNPYDPATYLTANPWAQEFDPYAPAWLLLSAALSPLPYPASALVFMLGLLGLAALFCIILSRWAFRSGAGSAAAGSAAMWVAPALLLWLNIWFPGRSTLEAGSTFVVAFGVLLALRSLDHGYRTGWLGPLGVSLSLVKPQFGLPLCVLLIAVGAWKTVWKGVALIAIMSTPALVACVLSSGGPLQFSKAIARDVAYASSPDAPTGLLNPLGGRVDGLGLAVRLGAPIPPTAVQTLISLVVVALAALLLRYGRPGGLDPRLVPTIAVPALLLVLVHLTYDYVLCVIPALLNAGSAMRLPRTRVLLLLAVFSAFPVLHLHRATVRLLGASPLAADLANASALLAAVAVAVWIARTRGPSTGLA